MIKKIVYGALTFAPGLAFAAPLENLLPIITVLGNILRALLPMAFGLAILYFFYGIAKYVSAAGDAKKAEEGRGIMIWGVIAIAVMASLWGLVGFLQTTLGVPSTSTTPTLGSIPVVPGL